MFLKILFKIVKSVLHAPLELIEVTCRVVGKFFVTARFTDLSVVKYEQYVTVADRAQSMGNNY